jgi:hypothetical protein
VQEIPQTIRDNLAILATRCGGLDKVTDEDLVRVGRTRRELEYFILDQHDEQRDTQEHIASDVAKIEANTGEKVDLPKLEKDRLGLLRLKDPPEEIPPTGEPEPGAGREPPPGTSWG